MGSTMLRYYNFGDDSTMNPLLHGNQAHRQFRQGPGGDSSTVQKARGQKQDAMQTVSLAARAGRRDAPESRHMHQQAAEGKVSAAD
jgi:hypothetical protein